jgi:hypothetical protein
MGKNKGVHVHGGGGSGAVYGLGLIGSWVYFIGNASSFWNGVGGFFEAFVWPALIVFKALELFKM